MFLSEDVEYYLYEFMDTEGLGIVSRLCKKRHTMVQPMYNKALINNLFSYQMHKMFGNIRLAEKRVLKFQNRFIGWTDYMDGIKVGDVEDSIMIGVDRYRRPFITVRVEGGDGRDVLCIFQRYTGEKSKMCLGVYGGRLPGYMNAYIGDREYEFFNGVVKGEVVAKGGGVYRLV